MTRVYTLPFGVVPVLPASLAGLVTLGDVCPDGLVRSVRIDRDLVTNVKISASFGYDGHTKGEDTVVWVFINLPAVYPKQTCAGGGWSVNHACPLEPSR